MDAVGEAEFHQDVGDVSFGGGVADDEVAGDLGVGQALGEEDQYFELSWCERAERRGRRRLGVLAVRTRRRPCV